MHWRNELNYDLLDRLDLTVTPEGSTRLHPGSRIELSLRALSRTVVEKRENLPSSPEIFVATYPNSEANSFLLREWHKESQRAVFRVFLDWIYPECGYAPW